MPNYIQLSIDDTLDILKELTEKQPASVFAIERFRFLQNLHQEYGAVISLYAFFQDENGFSLAEVPDRYRKELQQNASWLRFGAHSTNKRSSFEKEDGVAEYERILRELTRIAGKECVDTCFRPHFFVISPDTLRRLRDSGLALGVHCPDDERRCHDFSPAEKETLSREGYLWKEKVLYVKTQTRMENLTSELLPDFFQGIKDRKIISVFTHECFLSDEEICNRLRAVCSFAKQNGLLWAFPMDII